MRRLLAGAVVLGLLLAPAADAAGGAQLGFVRTAGHEVSLETSDAAGGSLATLAGSAAPGAGPVPFFLSPPSWSGDGRSLLFVGTVPSLKAGNVALYAAPAGGGAPVLVPGTAQTLFPIGLPDGESVAVLKSRGQDSEEVTAEVGGKSHVVHRSRPRSSIWIVSLDGAPPRQVTPWSTAVEYLPTSVSPDGRTLVVTRITTDPRRRKPPRSEAKAMLLDLATGRARPLGSGITGVAYSPDGTRMAIVVEHRFPNPHVHKTKQGTIVVYGQNDIYVEDLASGRLTPVAVGPARDGDPSWDPSGQRLSFVRYGDPSEGEAVLLGSDDSVYEVNADGSCLERVLHEAGAGFIGPAWRPGLENVAGPIAC
jgi:Tol biopolymer transport system component